MPYAAAAAWDFINHAPESVRELNAIADWGSCDPDVEDPPGHEDRLDCMCDACKARDIMVAVARTLAEAVGVDGLRHFVEP